MGVLKRVKTLSVKNPGGVDTGDLPGGRRGEAGEHGAPAGDLWRVQVRETTPYFEREAIIFIAKCRSTFAMAAPGGEIEVPTLDGRGC